jgi:hypothetical protein
MILNILKILENSEILAKWGNADKSWEQYVGKTKK